MRIGEASKPGPPFGMYSYGHEEMEDTADDTVGGVAPEGSLHHGPEVEFLSLEGTQFINSLFEEPAAPTPAPLTPPAPILRCVDPLLAVTPPPPPLVGVVPVVPPILKCPLCTGFSTREAARGLILHLVHRHAGETVNGPCQSVLAGLDRGVCVDCGALRPYQSRVCQRCNGSNPPRVARVGDCLLGTRRHEESEIDNGETEVSLPGGTTNDEIPLPTDGEWVQLLARVRKIPGRTEIHIPVSSRARLAEITNKLLRQITSKNISACYLEEIRSKCLLFMVPMGRNRKVEMAI